MKLWHVKLKVAQQAQLVRTVSSGVAPARQLNRAHILLMANEARARGIGMRVNGPRRVIVYMSP